MSWGGAKPQRGYGLRAALFSRPLNCLGELHRSWKPSVQDEVGVTPNSRDQLRRTYLPQGSGWYERLPLRG
eukprot:3018468-Heterocapsa_arctica.AAC.1